MVWEYLPLGSAWRGPTYRVCGAPVGTPESIAALQRRVTVAGIYSMDATPKQTGAYSTHGDSHVEMHNTGFLNALPAASRGTGLSASVLCASLWQCPLPPRCPAGGSMRPPRDDWIADVSCPKCPQLRDVGRWGKKQVRKMTGRLEPAHKWCFNPPGDNGLQT